MAYLKNQLLSIFSYRYLNIKGKRLTDIIFGGSLMKSLGAKISFAGMASLFLIAASLLGFGFVMPNVAASSPIGDDNTLTAREDNGISSS